MIMKNWFLKKAAALLLTGVMLCDLADTPERHIYIDIGADNKISSFELSVEDC